MPLQVHVGQVVSLEDPKPSRPKFDENGVQKIQYVNQVINLQGFGTIGGESKVYFLYRPEWFVAGFDPEKYYSEFEGCKGAIFTYGKNIANNDDISTLQGLCGGSVQKLAIVMDALLELAERVNPMEQEDEFVKGVKELLEEILITRGFGKLVIYVLKQGKDQAGNRTKYYNVDSFAAAYDEKAVTRSYNSKKSYCDRNPEKMVMAFDLGDIPAEALTAAAA